MNTAERYLKMREKEDRGTPLYGTIPATGERWTVYLQATRDTAESHSGYGPFPRADYPGIPVIDFRTAPDLVAAMNLPDPYETTLRNQYETGRRCSLAELLRAAKDLGIVVYRPSEPIPPYE